MKLFWLKNKVLIAAMCAMLVLGVAFWGGLRFFEGKAMEDAFFRTSFAETEATSTPIPGEMPVPTAAPTELPAELVAEDILNTEWKYKDIFPRITNIYSFQAKTWKEGEKVDDALADAARQKTKDIFFRLFNVGGENHDFATATVTRYVDESGYRENVLRLTGKGNSFACVLTEKDLNLLIADNARFSALATLNPREDAGEVAEYLGTTLGKREKDKGGSTNRNGKLIDQGFSLELSDGRWITLSYTMNTLHGIQVHADEYAMEEAVCFQADIRRNSKVVHLVAPENFEQGDIHNIAEGDMSVDQVTAFYRKFLSAANGRASERRDAEGKSMEELDYNLKDWDITYFLDKSGYRENFYRINNDFVHMDIAAKSGYIVRAECNELYNPDDGLKLIDIGYDHMGGPEYEAYMHHVIDMTFGPDSYDSIGVNAVYDGDFCTMDADMKDGCTYEFGFAGGRLMYVEHYLHGLDGIPGWFADNLYVNTITGEEFYQAH